MEQQIVFEGAHQLLKEGVDLVANVVKATAGPRGRNVIIHKGFGNSEVTNDGVTAARAVDQQHNPALNMGVTLVQGACSDTEEIAGDGTTAAAVLLQEMVTRGIKSAAVGSNVISLKRGMDKATASILNALDKMAMSIHDKPEMVRNVATISTNNDAELGKVIGDSFNVVGKTGVIALSDEIGLNTRLDMVEGLKLERGYMSEHFRTNGRTNQAHLEEPLILVSDARVENSADLTPIAKSIAVKHPGKPLLVFADGVGEMALTNFVMAFLQQKVNICLVKTPGFGDAKSDMTQDLAAAVGAKFISSAAGFKLRDVKISDLGTADNVIVGQNETTIIKGKANKELTEERLDNVKAALTERGIEDYEKGILNERVAILNGRVAMITVGAISEQEQKEKRRRIDDALAATRAAMEEGIVPGGGVALIMAFNSLEEGIETVDEDEYAGVKVVMDSLRAPFDTILRNGGIEPGAVFAQMNADNQGYGMNVKTGEMVNLMDDGVVDPVKVIKTSLMTATSSAGMMITTDVLICEKTETED